MRNDIKQLLEEIDNEFTPRLSQRLNIDEYVDKIILKSMILPVYDCGVLNAFISFYCNDQLDKTAYLTMIAVRSAFRKKGIAKLLLDYATGFLKRAGFEKFLLEVHRQNVNAIRLYQQTGFTVFKESGDVYFMVKKIE